MKKLLSMLAVLTAVTMIFASCDKPPKEDETIPVTEIKITPENPTVVQGENLTLKAEVLPENATNKKVTWGSRDKNIVKIDSETGVITGSAVGTAEVWAKSGEVVKSVNVEVTAAPIRVESVTLSKTELALFAGKKEQIFATTTPAAVTYPEQKWASSDEAIATVDGTGVITAVAEGNADITVTIDEKTATCKVTVTIPAVADIETPYLSTLEGNTVTMTAAGFKAGDKIKLEAVAGDEYTSPELDVKDITVDNAKFDLPADIVKTRSYRLSLIRGGEVAATSYLRPDDQMVRLPYALGYYMTGDAEVVPNDPNMSPSEHQNNPTRRGYMSGKIVELDEDTRDFMVWKADAKLSPITAEGTFELTWATGVTTLQPLYELYGPLTTFTTVDVCDCYLETLDMTMFPNAVTLLAWGQGVEPLKNLKSVNFGTFTTLENALKLQLIHIERQSITGEVDLRNCPYLNNEFAAQDNQITSINFGKANEDHVLLPHTVYLENNQLREVNIENLGQVRRLKLAGNPIERLTLLNNSKQEGSNKWMFIFKAPEAFSLTWASAEEAQGPRVFNIEHYWWRYFSDGNQNEINNPGNGLTMWPGGWVENNPIVQACKDGVEIICWTYHGGGGQGDAHIMEGHDHKDGVPCPYDPSIL